MSRRVNTVIVFLFLSICLSISLCAILAYLRGADQLLATSKVKINLDGETAQATANIIIETTDIPSALDAPQDEWELPEIAEISEALPELPNLPTLPKLPQLPQPPTIQMPNIPWDSIIYPILALKERLHLALEGVRMCICSFLLNLHKLVDTFENWVECNLTSTPPYSCRLEKSINYA